MEQDKKQKLIGWLVGPRNYREGVELYRQFGANLMLKRRFLLDPTPTTKTILANELRKLAGITEEELAAMPRRRVIVAVAELAKAPVGTPMSETQKKMIRFRDRYPFLRNPNCPDILKVLVADLFTAYGQYKEARAKLDELPDEATAEAAQLAETTIEAYLADREIWAELDYYAEHGTLLGKSKKFVEMAAVEDLTALDDIELVKKLQSARTNASKWKKKADAAEKSGEADDKVFEQAESWMKRKLALEAEVDRRKKK